MVRMIKMGAAGGWGYLPAACAPHTPFEGVILSREQTPISHHFAPHYALSTSAGLPFVAKVATLRVSCTHRFQDFFFEAKVFDSKRDDSPGTEGGCQSIGKSD